MIQLKQNQSNLVTLDLTSNSNYLNFSGISPYYLFEFTSEVTSESIYFVTTNIAPLSARTRYDQFLVIETGSTFTNLTAGTVNLSTGNFWLYNVYEQLNQFNLDPKQALDIVNTGRVFYTPNITNGYVAFTGNSQNNIYFKTY